MLESILLLSFLGLLLSGSSTETIKEENLIDQWGIPFAGSKGKNWPVVNSLKKIGTGPLAFHASRESGKRYHAGMDLYSVPGDSIVAMDDGVFLNYVSGYVGLDAVLIQHGDINVLYGEFVALKSFKSGDKVFAGQKLGIMANSKGKSPDAVLSSMLHIETWDSSKKFLAFIPWYTKDKAPTGLLDPTKFLERTLG